MVEKIQKSEQEWMQQLTPEQFQICRLKGTERPYTGKLNDEKGTGVYKCICCGHPLFASGTKFESGSGWPSFYAPLGDDAVATEEDVSHGMRRVEVTCAKCASHLGHVFDDGPKPTGLRYCMNSVSLDFDERKDA
jgi:peptide-methionine (R)-S-oxide reductase